MLPRSYNSGYSNDIRGFKKRNRTLKLYQQASPYLAAVLLILTLVIGLTLSANVRHEKASLARLEANHKSKETELRNLVNSLDQERRSRVSAENGLRETNSQLSGARRELHELKQNQGHKDQHCQSLQESFDRTRIALEAERDNARKDLEDAKRRIFSLEAEVGAKESTIDAHKIVAVRKDELHASKEKQWEALRSQLEEQLKKQGDFIPQHGVAPVGGLHPDYAAKEGTGVFHFTSEGHRERYIDTAKDLATIGVVDPQGIEHLAAVMGHLLEIKQAEYAAIQKAYPASNPPPKPPIGHWMALNLERMGIKIPHGVLHLSFFLDAHFALDNNPDLVGRAKDTQETKEVHADPVQVVNAWQLPPPPPPAHISLPVPPPTGAHPEVLESEDPLGQMGRKSRRNHRVDAAGFI